MLPNQGYGGSNGPYLFLLLDSSFDNLDWNALNSQPLANNFKLTYSMNMMSNPSIGYDIIYSEPVHNWLSIGGPSVSGNSILVAGGSEKNISVQLIDIDTLPNGVYHAEIIFEAKAVLNGINSSVDVTSYFVTLTIFNNAGASITLDKNQYNVFFNRQTQILSGETAVSVLNNSEPLNLKFVADNFVIKNNVIDSFAIEELNINSNPNLPNQGSVPISGGLFKADNTKVVTVNINLTIGLNSEIFIDKDFLAFSINKASPQTSSTDFYITNPENKNFTITAPSWLNVSPNNGSGSGYITVTTVSSSSIGGGDYSGNIVISYDGKSVSLPVFLKVVSFMYFQIGDSNFCKDIPNIILNKMSPLARIVRITVTAKFNLEGSESTKENIYTIPYVGDKADFNLGEKINNQFPRKKGDFFSITNSYLLMKNSIVNILCEELDASYVVLKSETLTDVKLFPGSKPIGFPLLSNFLFRKKNKNSVFFNSKIVGENIIIEKHTNTKDIVELHFADKTVTYYDFPKYFNIVSVHFENQNLSPEWFTMTGEYKITADFSHIYANSIFKSQNEKYDISKVKMLSINTGFILKEEIFLIENLVESKLAFLQIQNKIYRCFSTTSKLILDDSSEEIVNRDLEFLIVEM